MTPIDSFLTPILFSSYLCSVDHRVVSIFSGGARGVMVIVVGNEHGDTSSNPGQDCFAFHIVLILLGNV